MPLGMPVIGSPGLSKMKSGPDILDICAEPSFPRLVLGFTESSEKIILVVK
jgi:hypothetical protein